jgi:hypothetical protein
MLDKYRGIHHAMRAMGVKVDFSLENNIAIAYYNKDTYEFKAEGFTKYTPSEMRIIEYCNGLVFNITPNGDIFIVVLPCKLVINYENRYRAEVDANIKNGKYTIIPSIDGTNINMYYRNGNWIISTTRNYYMNKARWLGPKTYEMIVSELLGIDSLKNITWDKNTYYNLIFHHSDFHPANLTSLSNGIWNYDPTKPLAGIPEYPSIEIDLSKHDSMKKISTYFTGSTEILYGFVLKSKDPSTIFSNVVLKTTLFLLTEEILYEFPFDMKQPLDNISRPIYIAIRAYFNTTYREHCTKYIVSYAKTYFKNIEMLVKKMRETMSNLEKIIVTAGEIVYDDFQQYVKDNISIYYTTDIAADIEDFIVSPKNHIHLVNLYQILFPVKV